MPLTDTIFPDTDQAELVPRNDTALYKDHGFWVPVDLFHELNHKGNPRLWCSRVIWSTVKRTKTLLRPLSKAKCGFFERLPLHLLIYFLDQLTERCDLDALRSLLVAYEWMKELVVIIDDQENSDIDLFHVPGLRHTTMYQFLSLPLSDPIRRLPVKIFTVTGNSMMSFNNREVFSVLNQNTPVIVRLYGPDIRLADDLRAFIEVVPTSLTNTLPLVLCQDKDKKHHPHICFPEKFRYSSSPRRLQSWMETGYQPFPFKRPANPLWSGNKRKECSVEYYNIHDWHARRLRSY